MFPPRPATSGASSGPAMSGTGWPPERRFRRSGGGSPGSRPRGPVTAAGQRRTRTDFPRCAPRCAPAGNFRVASDLNWLPPYGATPGRVNAPPGPASAIHGPHVRTTSPLHAVTWLVWAVAAAACVQLAPNPLYVAHRPGHQLPGGERPPARHHPGPGLPDPRRPRAWCSPLIRVGLTALTTHSPAIDGPPSTSGSRCPQATLPRLLGGFTVGGTIEGDIVLYAAAQAFAVVGILGAFGVFNAVASHHELVQAAPRAFHEPGLILTVAAGVRARPRWPRWPTPARPTGPAPAAGSCAGAGWSGSPCRSWSPGLERAVSLAESMDARGLRPPAARPGRPGARPGSAWSRWWRWAARSSP